METAFERFEEQVSHFFLRHHWIETLVDRGCRILIILAGVYCCAKLIHLVCGRILGAARAHEHGSSHVDRASREREKRVATVVKLVDTSLRVVLFCAAALMVLRELGFDITPLLTGAGIAGVAVGFGAQSLVRDVISGFFLLVEDQIRVGDIIRVNNALSGAVERMELRVTAIRDADGTLHIIPNGEIKSVSNMTYDFSRAVVQIPVPAGTDLGMAAQALSAVARELGSDPRWKNELRGQPEYSGIEELQPGQIVLRLAAKTEPHSRWAVARELRRRAVLALGSAGAGFTPPHG